MARNPALWIRVPNGGTPDNPAVYTAIRDSLREISEAVRLLQGGPSVTSSATQQAASSAAAAYTNSGPNIYLPLAGGTMTGLLVTAAPTTGSAGLRLPHGTAPSAPTNGDIWTTTTGLYARINGTTVGPFSAASGVYLPLAGGTMTGLLTTVASGTSSAGFNLPHGAAPTTPVNGDLWTTTTGIYVRVNGATVGPLSATTGTVTSVTGTSPVASSGGATPAISLSAAYGDTLNPYGSKTANFVLAAPNGSAGVPSFRALVAADIPSLSGIYLPLAGGTMSGAINMGTNDINNVGQVGIGTASPSKMLHLSSTGPAEILIEADTDNVTETDNARILFKQDGGGTNARVGFRDDNTFEIAQVEANDIVFRTTDTERVRITSGGNVGIGINNPGVDLEFVNTNAAFNTTTPGTTRYATHFRSGATNDQATGITWAGNNGTTTAAHAGIYVQSSNGYGTKMYFATTNSYATGAVTAMTIDHNRFVGINTAPSYRFHVDQSDTASTSGTAILARSNLTVNPAAASTALYYGTYTTVTSIGANANNDIYGSAVISSHNGTNTIANVVGSIAKVQLQNTGSVTTAYTLLASAPSRTGAGTISTAYGLYIAAHKITGVTTGYGLYQAGASDLSVFEGYLGVGGSPSYPLHVLETLTGTGDNSVEFIDASITPSSASTASYAGVRVDLDDTGANLTGNLRGGDFNVTHAGTNTLASAVGVFAKSSISSTGNVSAAFALYASGPSNSSTGVMTSSSGLYIATQKGTNVTTGYGVYQASSADLNIFVGKTAIGSTTTPTQTLEVTGTGYFSGDVGIGVAPSNRLHVFEADTATTSGSVYLAQLDFRATPAAPSTATYIGLQSSALVSGANAVGDLYGAFLYATHNSSSTATGLFGVVARYLVANTGSATSGVALFAATPSITSTGTITNGYGLYVNTQKVTGVTNGYGIYQAGTSDVNYYGGRVFLNTTDGTTDPNARLLVREDTNGATGMAVRNNDTGTAALSFLALNTSTTGLVAYSFGSGYTTSGLFEGNGTALVSTKTNGLNIGATNAAGLLKFYTGGSASGNERMRIASNGNVTVDTNVLFVDAVNNRVGVNTTPTVALDVTGAAAVSGALTLTTTNLGYTTSGLQLRSSVPGASVSTDYFFHRGADTTVMDRIVVHTPNASGAAFAHMTSGGVTRFVSDGNTGNFTVDSGTLFVDAVNNEVGIGTTGPGQRLEVAGTLIVTGNSDMPTSAGTNIRITGGYASPDIGRIFIGDGSGWKLHFSSRTASTNTDRVTFTDAGRVGIGATTPGVRLDVSETLAVASSSTFSAAAIRMNPVYTATGTITVKHRYIHFTQPTISGGTPTFTDAHTMYFDAAAGTHRAVDAGTTKTTPGTVNAWVKIDINGTTYYIPAYTSKTA